MRVLLTLIAFGMIAALILDATIIRMLLVPAVMHLLREDNWWAPGFVKKAYAVMGHGSDVPEPLPATRPLGEDEEVTVHEAVPAGETAASRGGMSTSDNRDLVSFVELKARLENRPLKDLD